MNETILIVEDELHLAHGLKFNLEKEGFATLWAADGEQALKLFFENKPHLVLLDLMIPGIEGIDVLKRIREASFETPVLILSAKNLDQDKIRGLTVGADDYITKPFNLDELIIRIRKFLRRFRVHEQLLQEANENAQWSTVTSTSSQSDDQVSFGTNFVHLRTYHVKNEKGEFYLTEQEMKLLRIFLSRPGELITKRELLRDGWGYSDQIETRTLDIFMTRFRKYFEDDPKLPKHFIGQRGKGIIFNPREVAN